MPEENVVRQCLDCAEPILSGSEMREHRMFHLLERLASRVGQGNLELARNLGYLSNEVRMFIVMRIMETEQLDVSAAMRHYLAWGDTFNQILQERKQ